MWSVRAYQIVWVVACGLVIMLLLVTRLLVDRRIQRIPISPHSAHFILPGSAGSRFRVKGSGRLSPGMLPVGSRPVINSTLDSCNSP